MMQHFWQNIPGWVGDNPTYRKALDRAVSGEHFVEIGVYHGRSAAFMAVEIANRGIDIKFDAIDHFKGSAEHGDLSATLYDACMKNLEPVKDYVNVVKMDSPTAVKNYKDNSLDFVFVDASHDYDSVIADLKAWYKKVKPGGIFAGDDYQPSWPGVIKAVNEFSKEIGVEFYIVPDTCHWLMHKPK
jgi:predicted O-methyltransferase YrrM